MAPDSTHVILAGDFNMSPGAHAIRYLVGLDSLAGRGTFYRDAWARRHPHEDGYTWSRANPYTVRSIEQDRRIDYIFVQGSVTNQGERIIEDARVVLDSPASDSTWPSDHFGVFAIIGVATQRGS
jgi:endonuclease/exonuclease/phosphatase family metal-dependent hydrolase